MTTPGVVPALRVSAANDLALRRERAYVLYWMTANRRLEHNFALDHAVARARELDRPLVVLEALRCDHRWASRRFHRFVIDGMAEHVEAARAAGILYHPYVEPEAGAGRGLVAALAARAALVVTDDSPAFFLPAMTAAAARAVDVRLEKVDSNGLLPLRATDAEFPTAYAFRRFLQKSLRPHLADFPSPAPFDGVRLREPAALPPEITRRWPRASDALLAGEPRALTRLPVDAEVTPVETRGGAGAARERLAHYVAMVLPRYGDGRSDPSEDTSSRLSPWLHFGHLSAHETFLAIARSEGWSADALGTSIAGKKTGWWGVGASAESFLDELVTWRELGFVFAHHRPDYAHYGSLPAWSRATLAKHASDPREHVYTLDELAAAETHDELWNAAQRQLRREGRIHNYLRMLWGKKVLEWSASPEAAFEALVELNNRWALDGRDPNSYSGIGWVLGRFDRPWGPERKIFGTVRYMSSQNTARKIDVDPYLARYAQ